jgi:hypothetical protein
MKITLAGVLNYARQPTTIAGLSALAGVATGLFTGELSPAAAVPAVAFGLVMIAVPENKAAQADAKALAADAVAVVAAKGSAATLAPALADAAKLAGDFKASA